MTNDPVRTGKRSLVGLLLLIASALLTSLDVSARDAAFTNPILAGGYPDPSICRVGNDYYIVNSTFEYYPGLPIHHSTDLVNWELVGHGLHREEQVTGRVNLVDVQSDGGIHAPTIRCHGGKFYIITTNVYLPNEAGAETQFVNFIITADKVQGPWSEPRVLDGAPGIDPDIFFDDDGRVWYVGTHSPDKPNFPGEGEIWLQEIDLQHWKLKGERHFLWRGACGGVWAEGPHMYKRGGRYYLMVAEGGTSYNHAMVIAVSDEISGPYRSNPRNPIMTSRHLSYDNWVNSTGHADLVELPDGRWYMVALGIRADEERRSNMGRESHLIPVSWEREPFSWKEVKYEWPVAAPLTGRVERSNPLPFAGREQYSDNAFSDNFDQATLGLEWNFRRVPRANTYSLTANAGYLRLYAGPDTIGERSRASLMGFRQRESDFEYTARMRFLPTQEQVEAGINLFQKDDNYLSVTVTERGRQFLLELTLADPKAGASVLQRKTLEGYAGDITFRVSSRDHSYRFDYSLDRGRSYATLSQTRANHILSKVYTGAYLGVYATSNGRTTGEFADFDWVRYEGFERQY